MVEFNPIQFIKTNQANQAGTPKKPAQAPQAQPAQQAQPVETNFDIDMSAADIQATMNKAMGLSLGATKPVGTNYAAVEQAAAQDPIAFIKKHAPAGAYESVSKALTSQLPVLDAQEYTMAENHADAQLAQVGPEAFVARHTTVERRAEIEAGFAQRNPNAFTGEFLDLFAA